MYENIVNSLRYCAENDCSPKCPRAGIGKGCIAGLKREAADAIEELSAKATPKRVGFAGWKGCRNTRYKCPYCNKNVCNNETYCHKCGQALMFPYISHTPYVPGEKQEVIVTWPDEPPKEE